MKHAIGRLAPIALALTACVAFGSLAGCSSANEQLRQFIAKTEAQPGGHVKPLPVFKPYQTFVYADQNLRSPFVPSAPLQGRGLRPDPRRHRQFLEQFPLDTLRMVGTLKIGAQIYGLIQTRSGLVNRVRPGNYIGQHDGKITSITPAKIFIREIVPDGSGGYMKRPAALALN